MINYLSDTAIIKNKNNEACLFIIDNLRYVYSKPRQPFSVKHTQGFTHCLFCNHTQRFYQMVVQCLSWILSIFHEMVRCWITLLQNINLCTCILYINTGYYYPDKGWILWRYSSFNLCIHSSGYYGPISFTDCWRCLSQCQCTVLKKKTPNWPHPNIWKDQGSTYIITFSLEWPNMDIEFMWGERLT